MKDLKNVRLELNPQLSHPYAWWFSDRKENNTSDAQYYEGPAAKKDGSGRDGCDSDEEDSSEVEECEPPVEELETQEQTMMFNDNSNSRNSESRSEKRAQSYNLNSSHRNCRGSPDGKVQKHPNEHKQPSSSHANKQQSATLRGSDHNVSASGSDEDVDDDEKSKVFNVASMSGARVDHNDGVHNSDDNDQVINKGLSQFVAKHCIVVQLTGIDQEEPALYHFESDKCGGSDIDIYAVNSRTKKMLLQFYKSDAVASIIKHDEHVVNGNQVIAVQKACEKDLTEFAGCKVKRMVLSQESDDEENEDEEQRKIDSTSTIVIELPKNLLITTDAIRMHFENEEYGGDDIRYLHLQPEKQRVLVTFNSGKDVVDQVLSHSSHKVCGTIVKVRRCSSHDLAD